RRRRRRGDAAAAASAAARERQERRHRRARVLHVVFFRDDVFELIDEVVEVPGGAVEQLIERHRIGRQRERQNGRSHGDFRTILHPMKRALTFAFVVVSAVMLVAQRGTAPSAAYYPERFDWQHRKAEDVGMNSALVNEATQLAVADETTGPKDMTLFLKNSFGKEPFDTLVGPIRDRGGASGLITRHGYIVAEWGDPRRVDITNSVTKTFLTTVVGLAWQRGLIHDV